MSLLSSVEKLGENLIKQWWIIYKVISAIAETTESFKLKSVYRRNG